MNEYLNIKIPNRFISIEQELDSSQYLIGETIEDYYDGKWIKLSEEQKSFHDENPTASPKEVINMALKPIEEPNLELQLQRAKEQLIEEVNKYDNSDNVNSFTINDNIKAWFTPQQRADYKQSVDSAKLVGLDNLQFFVGDVLLEVSVEQAEQMLAVLQLYANQCYIVTKKHLVNINSLDTIEEVNEYDYTIGYPNKLNFKI